MGSDTSEPSAMDSSSRPRAEGWRWRRSRTCGMREAQLAKAKPEPAKAR
jgi:hypothetical protein